MITDTMRCPECGADVPVDEAWPTWCEHCNWDADQDPPRPPTDAKDRDALERDRADALAMHEAVVATDHLRPPRSMALVLADAVALAVHGISLGLLVVCVWWIAAVWPRPIPVALAALVLMLAFGLRPRLGRIGRKAITANRDEAPALYRLLDDVASQLGSRRVDLVVLDERLNASTRQVGFRRRRVLILGVPLWAVLGADGRVALVGHEIGHFVSRDHQRRFLVATAIATLAEWFDMMRPTGMTLARYSYGPGGIAGGDVVARGIQSLVARGVRRVWRLEMRLTRPGHQRAEYLADRLSAQIAGPRATVEMLDTLGCSDRVRRWIGQAFAQGNSEPFDEARRQLAALPARELRRIRVVRRLRLADVGGSHPPLALRIEAVESRGSSGRTQVLSGQQAAAIDAELAPGITRLEPRLRAAYRRHV